MFIGMLRLTAVLAAIALVPVAAFFGWWGLVVLSKLWAGYQDSAPLTYVVVGGALLGMAVASLFSAAVLVWAATLRPRRRARLG